MTYPKPKKGDVLTLVGGLCSSRARFEPKPVTVTKIGSRYFYVAENHGSPERSWIRFRIGDWQFDGDRNWQYDVYPSEEEYARVARREKAVSEIRAFFRDRASAGLLTDGQVEIIHRIIDDANENERLHSHVVD